MALPRGKAPTVCARRDGRLAAPGRRLCQWCVLNDAAPHEQEAAREARLAAWAATGAPRRERVPKEEWPEDMRWCSGCQSFVALDYVSGSRCKACASLARHAQAVEATYGITEEEYQRLFRLQGGRCAICRRVPRGRRLAVDHDHITGEPRGLLCGGEGNNNCNWGMVGSLEGVSGQDRAKMLATAKRLVQYMTETPYEYMRRTA
jgi:hypothetical protein